MGEVKPRWFLIVQTCAYSDGFGTTARRATLTDPSYRPASVSDNAHPFGA